MDSRACIVLGGGGHAKVVIDALRLMADVRVVGVLDAQADLCGTLVLDVPVLGGDERLATLAGEGVTHFVVGLAGIGPNPVRERLFELATAAGLLPLTVWHPSAVISVYAAVAEGAQLFSGAVVQAAARVGRGAIINTGVIVEHDSEVQAFAHVASGARLAGAVKVGKGAFVGAGATVIQGVEIGVGALVGAGAVVIRDVPPGARVVGVPARVLAGSKS